MPPIDWEKEFANAHLTSGPRSHGLMISKICPNGTGNPRSIWEDDEKMIMKAANKYGYRVLSDNSHDVSFIRILAP